MKNFTPEEKEFLKDAEWKHWFPVYERLAATDNLTRFLGEADGIAECFKRNGRDITCIDGRTPGGKHIAGQGMLLAWRKGDEYVYNMLRGIHPDGIWTHENCGAAARYAMGQGLDPEEGDRLAIEWAKKAAAAIGVEYKGHIVVETPFHPEFVAYYDGTGRLDPSKLESHLVPGFDITRQYHQMPGDAQEELAISLGIAFGKHGYAECFTKKTPFLVMVVGHPDVPGLSARKLLQEVIPTVEASLHRDRIKIVEMTPEQSWLL